MASSRSSTLTYKFSHPGNVNSSSCVRCGAHSSFRACYVRIALRHGGWAHGTGSASLAPQRVQDPVEYIVRVRNEEDDFKSFTIGIMTLRRALKELNTSKYASW